MSFTVNIHSKALKNLNRLPENARKALALLLSELEQSGPVRGNWPNYGKLSDKTHHCHLKKGRPCYVAVWNETEGSTIEVTYVGSHANAPY